MHTLAQLANFLFVRVEIASAYPLNMSTFFDKVFYRQKF